MPSRALQKFENNMIVDVDRIIEAHNTLSELNHDGAGRRSLGHVTRGGVLMLCAAWELYIEEVILEGVDFYLRSIDHPSDLPKEVQKELSRSVKESKHELRPLELAGEGWKTFYRTHARETLQGLNTPKSTNIDPLFKRFLGTQSVSDCWSQGGPQINDFVTVRGDIAHRGRDAAYVRIRQLNSYEDIIHTTVIDTDNFLSEELREKSPDNRRPWNRRNV